MKCILVVDDSITNLKFVDSVLREDYKLVLVKSGEKALQYLEKSPVDLVLLDIFMPEMDDYLAAPVEIVPLQLLAYYMAKENGCDIDKPKNLAKSVTVE